ncbi:MAG TPA: 1,4-alpha-glucan branching protein domain-containing protein [Thermoleophilaceae bacterium]|nr:1,4-alpha-glucan branching protein domain-containing protein [Thermoleophilaceae bacterium]
MDTVQRDQPQGVPALERTGERTLPAVPAENYWFRRHLAVYEWVAERCAGLEVVDMACGEGYGADVLARRATRVTGVDANPDAYEHARLQYARPGVRFERGLVESWSEPCDALVFLQTIEHVQDPLAVLRHFKSMLRPGGTAFVSTPNVLTLAPPGAEKSDNPWHVREYRAGEFRELCEQAFDRVDLLGLFHARVLRAHELALRAGWDRVHPALVLHSHMPYVEGFGTWPFGEEWLWEAVACSYLPLLEVLDGAPVTISLTPVLCDQLEVLPGEPGERFLHFLRAVRAPIHAEDAEGLERGGEHELAAEVRRAAGDYSWAEQAFERRGRDLVGAFGSLERVELWSSAATHALLPLIATDAGMRLQLATGVASHGRRFGRWGGGLWVPECAYVPGLEHRLAANGVRAFCIDQTAAHGAGAPEHLQPVSTEAGPVAVPLDWGTIELVWNERDGYPGHELYRDYHRRTVHDLKPWSNGGRPYDREAALQLAREHAADFVARALARVENGGLLCCALDTELLGHWWYEGPAWLEGVLAEAARVGLELVTVSEGIERTAGAPRALLESSWGANKDLSTWDSPGVAEFAFGARGAELRTVAAAGRASGRPGQALERAARELLALQASDWAFMHTRALAADYPEQRVREHRAAHDAALAALRDSGPVPAGELGNLAPDVDLASLTAP